MPDAAPPALDVRNVTVRYGKAVAVDNVSFAVTAGDVVCLLGRNGAGKSSLAWAITGLGDRQGEVSCFGKPLPSGEADRAVRSGLQIVPEGRQLFPRMSVEDNLVVGAFGRVWSRRAASLREDLEQAYGTFPRLADRRRQPAGTLSGGEQQMLAIGRALMRRPRVLVLDEPSFGLAPLIIQVVYDALRQMREQGLTMILIEESPLRALQFADRGIVLERGRVIHEGPASELEGARLQELYFVGADVHRR